MKPTSDHKHAYVIPSREQRLDRPDGKQFLMWGCVCGLKKAGNLLPKEEIDAMAMEYKKRKEGISQKSTSAEGAFLIEKGGDASVFQQ